MKLEILNFYFEKSGFKRNAKKKYFNYIRRNYEVKIFSSENKAFVLKDNFIIYETGLPSNEGSIVKWINLLIDKHEAQNN